MRSPGTNDLRAVEESFLQDCPPHIPDAIIVRTLPEQCRRGSECIIIPFLRVDLCTIGNVGGSNTVPGRTCQQVEPINVWNTDLRGDTAHSMGDKSTS